MNPAEAYDKLVSHSNETSYLGSTIAVLNWDERTYIPEKGHPHRAGQLTMLARSESVV